MLTAMEPQETSAAALRRKAPRRELCDLSVIVPIFNEEENIDALVKETAEALDETGLDYEMIFVDDGSQDASIPRLLTAVEGMPRALVVELRRNFGQTAAMAAGIEHSRGRVLVPMDGDLQNDPRDVGKLLQKLDGPPKLDIVSGWRKDRKDKKWSRRVPSQIANWMIRRFTGVYIHDFGCTLKAYRREVLEDVSLSSDLHRFLPALAAWHGAKIAEIEVNHRPRVAGTSKYGLWRTVRVLLDLVIVKFLSAYVTKPLYFFGKIGLGSLGLSALFLLVSILQKFGAFGMDVVKMNRNVLLSLSALLAFFTVQCVLFGVVSELLVRVYHDIRGHAIYKVRTLYGGKQEGEPQ